MLTRWIATALFAAALCLVLTGCQAQLFGGLAENEANAVVAALQTAGIQSEKRAAEEGRFAIFVDDASFAQAVKVLDDQAIPSRKYEGLGTVFPGGAMFVSPVEERARLLHAMQEELAQTVSTIDGVLEARVHIVLPEQDQLGRPITTPSAGVLVKHVDDARHNPVQHQLEIRRLLSASVSGLDEENIAVSFIPVPQRATDAAQAPAWKTVLGIRVAPESTQRLWTLLAVAAGVCLLAVIASLTVVLRRRKSA